LSLAFNFFSAPNSHLARPPISAESEAVDPPTREEALAAAPTATPSESEAADPPAQRDEALAAPTATPSGPSNPTLPKEAVSGILSSTISTTHRAEQVAHDRNATSADSGRHGQRGTNLARIKHHTGTFLRARPAHAHPHSVLPERCGATRLKLSCLPLRRVGARGPATHGPEGIRPSAPPWNSVPIALSPDFSRRMP
jgi:hypothetical protein